jgi:hypothetical protein
MSSLTGSCLCGAVRYRIDGPVGRISHCHCSMCRKAHGAAFATYGRVYTSDFNWLAGESHIVVYASSSQVERTFCGRCGANLQWRHRDYPDVFALALGTLDDDPGARPECHIYAASRAPWYEITDRLPVFLDDG